MHPADPLDFFPSCTRIHGPPARVELLRLDKIPSWASGNKFFKLRYYLAEAVDRGITHILSKGGMFSNHLEALVRACAAFGISATCLIRSFGDDPANPTLQRLRAHGARLVFLAPRAYADFDATSARGIDPAALFIPEGGDGPTGWRGTSEIVSCIEPAEPTHVIVPCGTFGTATGILARAPASWILVMVPAWKGCSRDYVARKLHAAGVTPSCHWDVWPEYHFGGFGRFDPALLSFMETFTRNSGVVLDPVYTGKMMFAVEDALRSGRLPGPCRVVALHTGGLQGLDGYRYRFPGVWGSYPPVIPTR